MTVSGIRLEEYFIAMFVAGDGGPQTLPLIKSSVVPLLKQICGEVPVRWFQMRAGPSSSALALAGEDLQMDDVD